MGGRGGFSAAAPEHLTHPTGGASGRGVITWGLRSSLTPSSPAAATYTCPGPHPTTWRPAARLNADRLGPGNQGAGPSRLVPSSPIRPLDVPGPVFAFAAAEAAHRPQETSYLVELGGLVGE